jgi:hypothetical protein
MSDPIRAALDKAADAARIEACKPGCCGEGTGCEVGPCHCSRVAAAAAIATFLHALPGSLSKEGAVWWYSIPAEMETHDWLAAAVLAAAKDQAND